MNISGELWRSTDRTKRPDGSAELAPLAPRRWHRTIPRFALSQWLRGGLRTSWTSWTSGTSFFRFFPKKPKIFEDHLCLFFILFHFFSTLLVSSDIVWSFESFFQHSFYPFLIILNHSYKTINHSYRFSMIFLFPENRCHVRSVFATQRVAWGPCASLWCPGHHLGQNLSTLWKTYVSCRML